MAQPRAKTEGSCCRYSMPRTRLILSSCLAPELVVWVWIYKQQTPWLYLTVTGTRIRLVKIPSKSLVNYSRCVKAYFNTLFLLTEQLCVGELWAKGAPKIAPRAYVSSESHACACILPALLSLAEISTLWDLSKRLRSRLYLANKRFSVGKVLIT